mgnify:CR=1 FL=1
MSQGYYGISGVAGENRDSGAALYRRGAVIYTVDKIQDTDTKKETQKETQKETETEVVEIKDNKVTSGRNVYELSNDELKLVEYNDQGQVVRIPAEIGGYSVTSIGSHAFKNNTSVQYLKLPEQSGLEESQLP